MSLRQILALGALTFLAACGGGGGAPTPGVVSTTLAAPTHLSVSAGGTREAILSWDPPQESVDGYIVEMQQGSGTFAPITPTPISASTLLYIFSPSAPEATDFGFRVYALKGSAHTDYTPVQIFHLGVNPPGQPSAAYDIDAGVIRLSWTRNTLIGDGVRIERAPYGTPSGWVELPVSDPSASTYEDASVNSGDVYEYRITNLYGQEASNTSQVSSPVQAGFLGPAQVDAGTYTNGIGVSWSSPGVEPVDGVRIERCADDGSGQPSGQWILLGTATPSTSQVVDTSWAEGVLNFYRVAFLQAGHVSPYTQSAPVLGPPSIPADFQLIPSSNGFHLSWTNLSQIATAIEVDRSAGATFNGGTILATLSPATSSFDDTSIPARGYYTFHLTVSKGYPGVQTQDVTAATPNLPGSLSFLGTSTGINPLEFIQSAALTPAGAWGINSGGTLIEANGSNWTQYPDTHTAKSTIRHALQLDPQGHPHFVYLAYDPDAPLIEDLVHVWFDGQAWQREVMAKADDPDDSYDYVLDASGIPHALMNTKLQQAPSNRSMSSLRYVHKVGNSWVSDAFGTVDPAGDYLGDFRICLDDAGAPHVLAALVVGTPSVVEYAQDGTGAWIGTELAPGLSGSQLLGSWADAANATAAFITSGSNGPALVVARKVNGTWTAPQTLCQLADGILDDAVSADRSRFVLGLQSSVGMKTFHLDNTGAWIETLAAPPAATFKGMGMDESNKAHLLVQIPHQTGYIDFHE